MIALEDLRHRYVYEVQARNFTKAVYIGDGKFVGVRRKFAYKFPDIEFIADERHGGTVRPVTEWGPLPDDIAVQPGWKETDANDPLVIYLESL